jgi:hypothetical protein
VTGPSTLLTVPIKVNLPSSVKITHRFKSSSIAY